MRPNVDYTKKMLNKTTKNVTDYSIASRIPPGQGLKVHSHGWVVGVWRACWVVGESLKWKAHGHRGITEGEMGWSDMLTRVLWRWGSVSLKVMELARCFSSISRIFSSLVDALFTTRFLTIG